EMMKRVGDFRAEEFYLRATRNSSDPAYELFLADYYRNFRGPQRPLFPDAEKHYFAALEKLKLRGKNNPPPWDKETEGRIERGLVALYQEDGVPFILNSNTDSHTPRFARPVISF